MFIRSCQLQSASGCIIQVSSSRIIFAPLSTKPIFLPSFSFDLIPFFLFPTLSSSLFIHHISFLLTSSHLPLPSHLFLISSCSLCSLIILSSHEVKPFNGSVGVLVVWGELPKSNCPAENHSVLSALLSVRKTLFISGVPDLHVLLPNSLNEL